MIGIWACVHDYMWYAIPHALTTVGDMAFTFGNGYVLIKGTIHNLGILLADGKLATHAHSWRGLHATSLFCEWEERGGESNEERD
jgi:hypothetical protein